MAGYAVLGLIVFVIVVLLIGGGVTWYLWYKTSQDKKKQCTQNSDCSSGQECVDKKCVTPSQCTKDSECKTGEVCLNKKCMKGCDNSSQCGTDEICVSEKCVKGCNNTKPCLSGEKCVGGACMTECIQNTGRKGCEPFPKQYCGKDNVCVNIKQCASSSDCPPGIIPGVTGAICGPAGVCGPAGDGCPTSPVCGLAGCPIQGESGFGVGDSFQSCIPDWGKQTTRGAGFRTVCTDWGGCVGPPSTNPCYFCVSS